MIRRPYQVNKDVVSKFQGSVALRLGLPADRRLVQFSLSEQLLRRNAKQLRERLAYLRLMDLCISQV